MTLSQLSERLGRPALWISRMRKQFGLPVLEDYPEYYETFLRKVRDLRNLGISDEKLVNLWNLERRLIDILHLDLGDGNLSHIQGCSVEADIERRLLLSNAELGVPLIARDLQTGLDFTSRPRELFEGKEMGEDALRSLGVYQIQLQEVMGISDGESKILKDSLKWAKSVGFKPRK